MNEKQKNDQRGMDTNFDSQQKQDRMNNRTTETTSDSSKKSTNPTDKIKDMSGTENRDSITRKEHDDTNHDHNYITPGDRNNESKTNNRQSSEQSNRNEDSTEGRGN